MTETLLDTAAATMQVTTFTVADLFCGISVLDVQEILRPQAMTAVPLAPGVVAGLVNLRGQIVMALDLRTRMGLEPAEPGRRPMNIVVRGRENAISLLVDSIGDVVELETSGLEAPPENLAGHVRDLVVGIHKLEGQLLLVLDLKKVLEEA